MLEGPSSVSRVRYALRSCVVFALCAHFANRLVSAGGGLLALLIGVLVQRVEEALDRRLHQGLLQLLIILIQLSQVHHQARQLH